MFILSIFFIFRTDDLFQISLGVKKKEIIEIINKLEAKLNFNIIESKVKDLKKIKDAKLKRNIQINKSSH